MTLPIHSIAPQHMEQFAQGFGSADAIAELQGAQISQRKLRLAGIIRGARLSLPADEWTLFRNTELQLLDESASTLDEMAADPAFGAWSADTARAFALGESDFPNRLLRLGGFAAAMTIRSESGKDFSVHTIVEDGAVSLPSLGRAIVEGASGIAQIHRSGPTITVTTADGSTAYLPKHLQTETATWQPTQWLHSEAGGQPLSLVINDVPALRDQFADPADRLTRSQHEDLQAIFDDAWKLLVEQYPDYAEGIAAGMRTIVPLRMTRNNGRSVTAAAAFGAAAMTWPGSARQLACTLVHEFQHSKLYGISTIVPLQNPSDKAAPGELSSAPWREDPRPAAGLLQGAYAHMAIVNFWRTAMHNLPPSADRQAVELEFARWYHAETRTVELLRTAGNLNSRGQVLLEQVQERLGSWASQLPETANRQALVANFDHEASWLMHNTLPDPEIAATLADTLTRGGAAPSTIPLPKINRQNKDKDFVFDGHLSRRLFLNMAQHAPDKLHTLLQHPDELARDYPYATKADARFALNEMPAACAQWSRQIQTNERPAEAWAGLATGLFSTLNPAERAAAPLLHRPDMAAAIYTQLSDAQREIHKPEDILLWSTTPTSTGTETAS